MDCRNETLKDRLKGIFWGLVVGDCLGSPIQFTSKDGHRYITEMEPCDSFGTPPGYWTDDSSMAFCVAESFVRLGRYDLRDVANNFVRWLRDGFWSSLPYSFDVGGATRSSISAFQRTGSLVNGTEDSQGNGSAMRLAPSFIVAFARDDLATIPREISDLTHSSSVVRKTIEKATSILNDLVCGREPSFRSPYKTREEVNNSGWAVSTVDAALWALENSASFEEGAILAVNLGGDADTIGAVFGQFGGAKYGFSAIPERWLAAIKDREKIDALIEDFLAANGFYRAAP